MKFEVYKLEIKCVIDHIHLLIAAKPVLDIVTYINTINFHFSRFLRKYYDLFLQISSWRIHI